jgi:REP element-mobilizing transposase RayT
MITRRCTQRQFLLRPDDETNNAFIYCLAEAAGRYGIVVMLTQMMSNHHHTVIYDPEGRINEFMEQFHKMLAKCQNVLRGRWENLWASEPPCVVEAVERNDVLDRLVYVATNPVKDGLVDRVHHWPGPKAFGALVAGRPLRADRPRHFFREDGPMPAQVELTLTIPPQLGDRTEFLAQLRERVAAVEAAHDKSRLESGRRVLGRGRVLRQSWRDCPTSHEPRRCLRPRVAARSKWARIQTLKRNRAFVTAYRLARAAWLAGAPIRFPVGTYALRRFANVPIEIAAAN